ncbi:hypothetical protein PH5382_01405 [Phaeobacter sp. CECT 5382]|nr:hypothetical protein PH5382_01405 [Phaeobacter sp. CECT 5382]
MKPMFDLFKAFFNASLLLLALCLFLGWKLFAAAEAVSDGFEKTSADFRPVHVEIQTMTQELAALSKTLERDTGPDSTEMRLRLARLERQTIGLKVETQALKQLPAQVMAKAAEAAAEKLSAGLALWVPRLSDCAADSLPQITALLD